MAHLSPGSPSRQRVPPARLQDVMAPAMPTAASLLTAGATHEYNKLLHLKLVIHNKPRHYVNV